MWELITQYVPGDERFYLLAVEAHKKIGLSGKVISAQREHQWVELYLPYKFTFHKVDVVAFTVQDDAKNSTEKHYVMKGLKPDCVYYLKLKVKELLTALTLLIERHVCGLTLPYSEHV